MADVSISLSTLILFTALLLAISIITQHVSSYMAAYLAAPVEITTFLDAADFSIQENESYERDIAKVQRLEDKIRLGRLLREIQRCGDDFREDLNRVLVDGDNGGTRLRSSARMMWKARRMGLEQRIKTGDMLRMRFLVVYMGLVAANVNAASVHMPAVAPLPPPIPPAPPMMRDPEKMASYREVPTFGMRPNLPHAATDGTTRDKLPLRRLATQAMGYNDSALAGGQRVSWVNVMEELQKSPIMHRRHASIESAMRGA